MNYIDRVQFNKALDLYNSSKFELSKEICILILKKNRDELNVNFLLSKIEKSNKNYAGAINHLNIALKVEPENIEILIELGDVYKTIKNYPKALENYEKVINLSPNSCMAYAKCAEIMMLMKQYQIGIDLYSKAYHLDNNNFEMLLGIASGHEAINNFELAFSLYDKVLSIKPSNIKTMTLKGELLRKTGKYEEAIFYANSIINSDPNNTDAYLLRATCYKDLKLVPEAILDYEYILTKNPSMEDIKYNLGLVLLMNSDYKKGWNLYESRWFLEEFIGRKLNSDKPIWNRQKDAHLLVWPEQGVGDEIMFSSILPDVLKEVSSITVMIDSRLIDLFKRSFDKKINFIDSNANINTLNYNYHIPIGSLAKFYRTSEVLFQNGKKQYLEVDLFKLNNVKKLINFEENKILIGVSWKSSNPKSGLKRSIDLTDVIKKFARENVEFINLQYGDVDLEIEQAFEKTDVRVINYKSINNKENIDGLATLIMCCDEVISIDNSTVHLSGALGKKTTVLLPKIAEWRWQLTRVDTPWYPSVSLKRDAIL
jgi:tetratricopeptide (TPR) repeat protein/ADP-heptose:LPS heptosyltransferase